MPTYAIERGATDLLHNAPETSRTLCGLPTDGMELREFSEPLTFGLDYFVKPRPNLRSSEPDTAPPERRTAEPCPACRDALGLVRAK